MIKILIKKNSKNIKLPVYKTEGSSGLDLEANIVDDLVVEPGKRKIIPTGLHVHIPRNYEIQIRPRSGLASKNGITVLNTPGTIDSDYKGEIKVILINLGNEKFFIKKGDRIAQMVISPIIKVELEEVNELPDSIRGKSGFGSTGTN